MKKIGLFLFSVGLSAAFGFANAAGGDPACYDACDYGYNHCSASAGACSKIWYICFERCDMAQGD